MVRMPTKLLLVWLALLSGCGAPEVATPPTIPPPQPPRASATATPQRPASPVIATPAAAAASPAGFPTPAPARAAQLPLDQPWVLTTDVLTAVGVGGQLTNLAQP